MIARLQILLPHTFAIPADQNLEPYEVVADWIRARVFPPYQSQVDRSIVELENPTPLIGLRDQLDPAEPQVTTPSIRIDGREAIQADALRIDFSADEFDRSEKSDEPVPIGFRLANDLQQAVRTLGRVPGVKPLSPESTVWQLRFLRDDGSELEKTPGLHRGLGGVGGRWEVTALGAELWNAAKDLPTEFEASAWDSLFLDALALLPEIGPAIVLAFSAIETRIQTALAALAAHGGIGEELWIWISERDDYRKMPSITEQLDSLLHAVSGSSLKDHATLWEAFQNLRKARNSFVHEGRAKIGEQAVTVDRARELVTQAGTIIDWIEALLPADQRRPTFVAAPGTVEITKAMVGPSDTGQAGTANYGTTPSSLSHQLAEASLDSMALRSAAIDWVRGQRLVGGVLPPAGRAVSHRPGLRYPYGHRRRARARPGLPLPRTVLPPIRSTCPALRQQDGAK